MAIFAALITLLLASTATAQVSSFKVVTISSSLSPQQVSQISHDLSAYLTSVTAQPQYTSNVAALSSALPSSVANDYDALTALATVTSAPAWFTAMPTEVQNYWVSVGNAEVDIVASAVRSSAGGSVAAGARLTGVKGAVGVAAVIGAAAVLL
ncbi:hypothetical protein LTR66_012157 [Elasticomyces elasticus]|nr:hypothetical protein LTR66_012157 [Elasticomyces elasticus]